MDGFALKRKWCYNERLNSTAQLKCSKRDVGVFPQMCVPLVNVTVSLIRPLNYQNAPRCCKVDFRPAVGDHYQSLERIRDVLIKYNYPSVSQ